MPAMRMACGVAQSLDDRAGRTGDAFDLQGGVGYAESVQQHVLDSMDDIGLTMLVVVIYIQMGRKRDDVGTDRPDIQMVNVPYPGNSAYALGNFRHLKTPRHTLQQDMGGLRRTRQDPQNTTQPMPIDMTASMKYQCQKYMTIPPR